jgi:hypothetical protein
MNSVRAVDKHLCLSAFQKNVTSLPVTLIKLLARLGHTIREFQGVFEMADQLEETKVGWGVCLQTTVHNIIKQISYCTMELYITD